MAGFVYFCDFWPKIQIKGYIELKKAENMYIDTTERINLISLKDIDIWPIYEQKGL